MCEIDVAKAQEMGLECYHMFSPAVVPLGDASQESLDTIKRSCMQDPQKVAPHAPAIQDYFSALGDRLLDQDQRQKRLDLACRDDRAALDVTTAAPHHARKAAASPPRVFTLEVVTFALIHVISKVMRLGVRVL